MQKAVNRCIAEISECATPNPLHSQTDREMALMGEMDWRVEKQMIERPSYQDFLSSKRILSEACGFKVKDSKLNPMLKDFQRDVLMWDVRRGKPANFLLTGLGKGPIQMDWARLVLEHTNKPTLIAAPLAVAQQFKRESEKFGIEVNLCKSQADVRKSVNITNYDRLDAFDVESFAGVALDESSCIKDWTAKTTKTLTERLKHTRYKLCSTATPSPNDHSELGTHAELLDVMTRAQMLAMFFEHDGGETSKWSLKGHGKLPYWKFCASWSCCVMKPSDLGYSDEGYDLPPLNLIEHIVQVDQSTATEGMLFRVPDMSATGLHKEMRLTCEERARKCAELVWEQKHEPWLILCNTNYEAEAIKREIVDVVEVRGSDPAEEKEEILEGFATGKVQKMLSKPSICGFGMNYQHCRNMAFVGLSYSFEALFQTIRRCWRFGQTMPVNAHIIIAETEGAVLKSIKRKEAQYEELQREMNAAMRDEQLNARHASKRYDHLKRMEIPKWL